MRVVEVREKTVPISSSISNAYIDFSKITCSVVALVTGRRQSNGIHRRTGRHARSQATPYAASARHSANAIERLCL